MKKIICIALALVMVLGLASTAFAAEAGNTITVENAVEGITYELYKMFDLSVDNEEDPTAFTYTINADWADFFGEGGAGADFIDVDEQGYVTEVDEDKIAELAAAAEAYAEGLTPIQSKTAAADGALVFTGLQSGYYLITSSLGTKAAIDTTPTNPNAVVREKNSQPPYDKEVQEDSDLTWGKANDAEIGQIVNYELTFEIVDGAEDYKAQDKMSSGLTYNGDAKAYIRTAGGDTEISAENYTLTAPSGELTFEMAFNNDYIASLEVGTEIVIKYSGTVNEDAVIAGEGNPNDYRLVYGDKNDTEWKRTRTYVWSMSILKYGNGDEANVLEGAEFVLLNEAKTHVAKFDGEKLIGWDEITEETNFEEYKIVTDASGELSIVGLDSDTYYLREIKAPAGYNKLASDVEVMVNKGEVGNDGIVIEYEPTEIKVNNLAGTELPSTGGIGTTIFYILGAAMAVCAVVVLVTRRRMTSEG